MDSIPGLGRFPGGGHGNLPQYSCLEKSMNRETWQATVHRVSKSLTFSMLTKIHIERYRWLWQLRWERICLQRKRPGISPWVRKIFWRMKWQPIPVFLPGDFHGQRNLVGYSPQDHKESERIEQLTHTHIHTHTHTSS